MKRFSVLLDYFFRRQHCIHQIQIKPFEMLEKLIHFHLRDSHICYEKIAVTQHKKLQTAQGLDFKITISWNSQSWKLRPRIQKTIYHTCCSPICEHFLDLEQLLQLVIILPQFLILLAQFVKTRVASIFNKSASICNNHFN